MPETKGSVEAKIARMRAAYEAWPDVDAYLREFRDDAVWHSPFAAGDVSGKEAIRAYLSKVLLSVEEWTVDIHDIVVSEAHTVVLARNNVRFTNGQVLQGLPSAEVLHQDDEGLATDLWPIFDTERYRKALTATG
jgi:ketosteroid isomerase-like protein